MYHFIVNRHSSSGKGKRLWETLERELHKEKACFRAHFTKYAGHASDISAGLTKASEPVTIIAVGGDGTANEVICGMSRFEGVTFGYIPTGSGNDLARGLGLAADPHTALSHILHPTRFLSMRIGSNRAGEKQRSFAVSSGIGFDAAVCLETFHSRIKKVLNKIRLGKLTYTGIALKQILLLKPVPMTLILDDNRKKSFSGIFFIAIMNLKYEGGGFLFCPEADPSDDYLDLCVVEQMSRLKALSLLPKAFQGKHIHAKGVHIYRCRKARIVSDRPLPVHTDGEVFGIWDTISLSLHETPLTMILG